ncbi:ty3-gypsy retrotransposon protein [Cucumis melo var. makuwa]|uniref:Ty3-gypsy retrotransposon protein n=1 Tax=Cucumis melo var. makuwa TaxID=1194695 RepID=A0A5A7T3M2_CUCMM|nr:ty3-gypsy retrotransposon protein [Cucumis melo var. makuwa]TYK19708.1 ty3-gypsy retrotransposon protein [Cucumis melo var. makuwa]
MLRDALAPFHAVQQTLTAPPPAPVESQIVSDQLSAEAKHLRDFKKSNPKTFDESTDNLTKAQTWLNFIETIFQYMKCLIDQKVQCAALFLEDRGTAWWETTERMLGGDVNQITWEQFKENFYAKFFSVSLRYAKQQEFLNLEQDDMIVEQCDVEFNMISRFSHDVVRDEAVKTEKFVRGLRLGLQDFVRAFRPTTHADALHLTVDMSLHERAHSSKVAGRGSTPSQKMKAESRPTIVPLPLPSKEEYFPLVVKRPSKLHMYLEVEPLSSTIFVSTPSGEVILSEEKIKACQVKIANHVLDVTLLVLDMRDFDVILGMDWLSTNHASIDYSGKEVVFNPQSAARFTFKRAGTVVLLKVISAISVMKTTKLLNHGTWSILVSVVDTREPEVSMSLEPVVREYPDVSTDELSRVPPPREIDFAIVLEPGTVPISRAPYRITPAS